jgi:CHAT domain-containing protein
VELQATAKLSAFFMRDLKEKLDESGNPSFSIAALLHKSQVRLLNTDEFNHPFYWAGMVLVGDPYWR